mmetsp:Transcript_8268/g.16762  ORF Transcript_8268/g.16762 Transcript_8268/m.16762 type:complete len:521 (-) Transcript_8268:1864-3426(-)
MMFRFPVESQEVDKDGETIECSTVSGSSSCSSVRPLPDEEAENGLIHSCENYHAKRWAGNQVEQVSPLISEVVEESVRGNGTWNYELAQQWARGGYGVDSTFNEGLVRETLIKRQGEDAKSGGEMDLRSLWVLALIWKAARLGWLAPHGRESSEQNWEQQLLLTLVPGWSEAARPLDVPGGIVKGRRSAISCFLIRAGLSADLSMGSSLGWAPDGLIWDCQAYDAIEGAAKEHTETQDGLFLAGIDMDPIDRVGALLCLSDGRSGNDKGKPRLNEEARLVKEGHLAGLLLVRGDWDKCVMLLEQYIQRTGDIQTCALLAASLGAHRWCQYAQGWLEDYRAQLDEWGLDLDRVKLDISVHDKFGSEPAVREAQACCTYCRRPLTFCSKEESKPEDATPAEKARAEKARAEKPKIIRRIRDYQCPLCTRRMPKCGVCQIPVQSICPDVERTFRPRNPNIALIPPPDDLSQLMSWCMRCSHGGHFQHLTDWFVSCDVCPVTDCQCKCASIDVPRMVRDQTTAT